MGVSPLGPTESDVAGTRHAPWAGMRAPRVYDLSAAGLAAALSAFELIRLLVSRGFTAGYTRLATVVMGSVFCSILLIAAIYLALHRGSAWLWGVWAFIAALSYGSVVRAGGARVGIVYMIASFAIFALLAKNLHWYTSEAQLSPSHTAR
jgi:hypothetical protein